MPQGQAAVESPAEILLAGYQAVKEAGYDYAETTVGMLMKLTEEELALLTEKRAAKAFEIQSCNSFLPGDFQVTDPACLPALTEYVDEAMRRMHLLGVQVVVFGSGKARTLPEADVPAELAAIEAFLRMCDEMGRKHEITVVIEPLNKKECNVFNSVSEGASMVRKLNLDRVKLLADAYHMYCENEYLCSLEENGDILCHTHVAEVPDRTYPGKHGGEYLKDFAKHLKGAGYCGRVTIECGFEDFVKEIGLSYPLMDQLFRGR